MCVCGLTEPLPVGLDLWSKAAYFPLELLFGFINQFGVLGDNLSFRLCRLHLHIHTQLPALSTDTAHCQTPCTNKTGRTVLLLRKETADKKWNKACFESVLIPLGHVC